MGRRARPRVAVIGGGFAGLECALSLIKKNVEVQIFEPGHQLRRRHVDWDLAKYPGDEKIQYWSSEGWGAGGGLSRRLGGRSLCYHGVFLKPENMVDARWGDVWDNRLAGDKGLYASISREMKLQFPELYLGSWSESLSRLGLRHVPQAARLDAGSKFEAYSPLSELVREYSGTPYLEITCAHVTSLRSLPTGRWKVEIEADSGPVALETEYDCCVLAASAIGNMSILSSTLRRDVLTTITDHFCVGMFLKFRGDVELGSFKHKKIWSGYAPLAGLSANIFVAERKPLPTGERLIELSAVVEQAGDPRNYSRLSVENFGGRLLRPHIHGNIQIDDLMRLKAVRSQLLDWGEKIAGQELQQVHYAKSGVISEGLRDARLNHYELAARTVSASDYPGVYCNFELPYGAFEHEACCHPIGNASGILITNDLEVDELRGVFVVGPGVFPRLTEANPALTIAAVSRWLAGHLSSSLH